MLVDNSVYRNAYDAPGNTRTFTISFPFLDASHIAVYQKIGEAKEVKVPASQYTISGAGDPRGGILTMNTAPAAGTKLVILRDIPITQLYNYTELDNFSAESHENALAKLTMICQQLMELSKRHLTVSATSVKTPEQMMDDLFNIATKAYEYMAQAKLILAEVQAEKLKVQAEGDAQVDRVAGMGDMAGLSNGVACGEQTWTLTADVAVGGRIELPNELGYIPGRHHLLMSYDGVTMSQTWFEEVPASGDPYGVSHAIITKMPFRAGQELHAWVSPLGLADVPELVERVADLEAVLSTSGVKDLVYRVSGLEDALADLSRRVVYSEPEN